MPDATIYYGKAPIPVLFENRFCFVLNKPSGLPVQGGEGIRVSLDSILSEKINPRPLLVHRLDRDTSGAILVAKTKEAAALFSKSQAGKRYLAVCFGVPEPQEGVIDLALNLQESKTFYRLISSGIVEEVSVSLLELELGTGRMHQIRRHLAMKNCPILGDDKYGDFPLNKRLRKTTGLKFMLLHAFRLVISSSPGLVPEGLDITAPLPEYFSNFLEKGSLQI
jgi:23S rRNA pseudouridine955/2504/2580 synthase